MRHTKAICLTTSSALLLASGAPASAADKRAYTLFNPTPDSQLRDMNTDRPDKTESPYTVDAGRIQIEADLVTYTYNSDAGVTTRAVDVLPFNFKVGLTHDTDFQIVYGSFSSTRTSIGGLSDTDDGFGDVTLRLKHNFWGNDGGSTALGIMPVLKIPANTLAGLNNDVEGGVIVPFAIDLGHGMGLGLMTEIDILKNETGGYDPSFVNSASLSFELTKQLGVYVEAFVERSTASGAETVVTIDSGVTYAVTHNLQLDAGANIGVTDAADDINVFVGISRRY